MCVCVYLYVWCHVCSVQWTEQDLETVLDKCIVLFRYLHEKVRDTRQDLCVVCVTVLYPTVLYCNVIYYTVLCSTI